MQSRGEGSEGCFPALVPDWFISLLSGKLVPCGKKLL